MTRGGDGDQIARLDARPSARPQLAVAYLTTRGFHVELGLAF